MAGSGPRRPHPPPSQPAVARVTPMVPEVSLFFPTQGTPVNATHRVWGHGEPRGRVPWDALSNRVQFNNSGNPPRLYNPSDERHSFFNNPSKPIHCAFNNPSNQRPSAFNNLSKPILNAFNNTSNPIPSVVNSPAPAPAPHQAPTPTQFRPQSEFSKMFAGVDMTSILPEELESHGDKEATPENALVSNSSRGMYLMTPGDGDDTKTFDALEKLAEKGLEADVSRDDQGRRFRNGGMMDVVRNGWSRIIDEDRSQSLGSQQHAQDYANVNPRSVQQNLHQNLDNIRSGHIVLDNARQNLGNTLPNQDNRHRNQNNVEQSRDNPQRNPNNLHQNQDNVQKNWDNSERNQDNPLKNLDDPKQTGDNPPQRSIDNSGKVQQKLPNLLFTPNDQEPGRTTIQVNQFPPYSSPNHNDVKTHAVAAQPASNLTSPLKPSLSSQYHPRVVSQSNPIPPESPSPLPPDLIQVLSWQNDQLRQLQKQVEILLQSPARKQEATSANQTPKSTCTAATMTSMLWPDLEAAMAKLAAATDTPDPPTVEEVNSSMNDSPQPSLHLDMPDYTPSEASPPQAGRKGRAMVDIKDIDSPVLGESVSMYESSGEGENTQDLYNNILGQVRRLQDVDGDSLSPIKEQITPTSDSSSQPSSTQPTQSSIPHLRSHPQLPTPSVLSRQSPPPLIADPAIATLERLRYLGISFISPSDLTPTTVQSSQPASTRYNSVYLPTAACPSMSIFSGPSPDTSMDINSLALKYLDDSQLTRLAEKHTSVEQREQLTQNRARPENEDNGNNYSMATHQFLNRYGLGEQTNSEKSKAKNPLLAKPWRNGHLDVIQETAPLQNTREEVSINRASQNLPEQDQAQKPQQTEYLTTSHINRQQPQRLQQHAPPLQWPETYRSQQQQSPLLQQRQTHRLQTQSPHLQQERTRPLQQQQSPFLQRPQQTHHLQQQKTPQLQQPETNRLQPQQMTHLPQQNPHLHQQQSPRLQQQIPQHLSHGSNTNIPNRILDITAIRQQPKLL